LKKKKTTRIITKPKPRTKPKAKTVTVAEAMDSSRTTPKPSRTTGNTDSKPGKAPLVGELLPLNTDQPVELKQVAAPPLKLKGKQQAFVNAYLIEPDATKAAITAGYSKKTAKEMGYENLTKPHLKAAIDAVMAVAAEKAAVTAEKIVKEMARHAFSDVRNLFDENDQLIPISKLDDDAAAVISSIEIVSRATPDGKIEYLNKIKLVDKRASLDMLAKHVGMYDKDNRQRAGAGAPTALAAVQITFVNAAKSTQEGDGGIA